MKKFGNIGVIGRFKPLHNGGALMLETVCQNSENVLIGLGSSNKYNLRNPFTAEESQGMIDAFLKQRFSNYSFVKVPDFGHIPEYSDGQKWRSVVKELFGVLDAFVSGNDYVAELLKNDYKIMIPITYIPKEKHTFVRATKVRIEMARGDEWKKLVPKETVHYLEENGLVERFRKEFGLQTLAQLAKGINYQDKEDSDSEKKHINEE